MSKRYEMCAETSKMNVVVTTKRGTQLFSCRTMGGGLYCREDPMGIRTGKGYRLIVETLGVSNL